MKEKLISKSEVMVRLTGFIQEPFATLMQEVIGSIDRLPTLEASLQAEEREQKPALPVKEPCENCGSIKPFAVIRVTNNGECELCGCAVLAPVKEQAPVASGLVDEAPFNCHGVKETIDGLEKLRAKICGYGPKAKYCDCKYGASREGEETGCPELRSAIWLLSHPTPPVAEKVDGGPSWEKVDKLVEYITDVYGLPASPSTVKAILGYASRHTKFTRVYPYKPSDTKEIKDKL